MADQMGQQPPKASGSLPERRASSSMGTGPLVIRSATRRVAAARTAIGVTKSISGASTCHADNPSPLPDTSSVLSAITSPVREAVLPRFDSIQPPSSLACTKRDSRVDTSPASPNRQPRPSLYGGTLGEDDSHDAAGWRSEVFLGTVLAGKRADHSVDQRGLKLPNSGAAKHRCSFPPELSPSSARRC